jgi:hypothetical protein
MRWNRQFERMETHWWNLWFVSILNEKNRFITQPVPALRFSRVSYRFTKPKKVERIVFWCFLRLVNRYETLKDLSVGTSFVINLFLFQCTAAQIDTLHTFFQSFLASNRQRTRENRVSMWFLTRLKFFTQNTFVFVEVADFVAQ